jgi:copper chaperone CopZ
MKNIFLITLASFLLAANTTFAQVKKAEIIATGLTCSMCSNAIYKQLNTIVGVDSVLTDLNTNTFTVFLKPDNKYAPSLFKENIEKAGFFIGSLIVTVPGSVITGNADQFIPLGKGSPLSEEEISIKIFDEGYVTQKEHKKYLKTFASVGTYAQKKPDVFHYKIENK